MTEPFSEKARSNLSRDGGSSRWTEWRRLPDKRSNAAPHVRSASPFKFAVRLLDSIRIYLQLFGEFANRGQWVVRSQDARRRASLHFLNNLLKDWSEVLRVHAY